MITSLTIAKGEFLSQILPGNSFPPNLTVRGLNWEVSGLSEDQRAEFCRWGYLSWVFDTRIYPIGPLDSSWCGLDQSFYYPAHFISLTGDWGIRLAFPRAITLEAEVQVKFNLHNEIPKNTLGGTGATSDGSPATNGSDGAAGTVWLAPAA